MAVLGLTLLVRGESSAESASSPETLKQAAGVVGLLFGYLLFWGTGLFALRTAIFLCLMLRWTGERWRPSVGVAAALTAVVVLAFQVGLKVALE
jgi:hypothetical protein